MRIFSGIQPTGQKTFGNYAGGVRQYLQFQELGDCCFCVVDMHSITVPYRPEELRESSLDLAALLFASGLDPVRSTIFLQSHNPDHPQAAWLLSSIASMGEMRRMTQFKDKSKSHEFVSAGLFTYPVLMAADILLYQTDQVPVGDDQRQHVELARDIAARFNQRFGDTFTLPQATFPSHGARIMDLQEPLKKMSTSTSSEAGKILLADTPDAIRRKIKSAVTDPGREVKRQADKPGISNLIEMMAVATGSPPEAIEEQYHNAGYGAFKGALAEALVALLAPLQDRFRRVREDPAELERLLALGAVKARGISAPTLASMYAAMGFTAPPRT